MQVAKVMVDGREFMAPYVTYGRVITLWHGGIEISEYIGDTSPAMMAELILDAIVRDAG